jgi:hypothetical protein
MGNVYYYFLRRLREECIEEKTREDKRRQEKTREDKRRQEKTREDKRRQETDPVCRNSATSLPNQVASLKHHPQQTRNTDVSNLLHLLRPKPSRPTLRRTFCDL